jgi:hypothetical protein
LKTSHVQRVRIYLVLIVIYMLDSVFFLIPFLLFLLSFSQSSTLVLVFKRTFNTYWQDAVDALQEQITFEDPSLGEDPDKPSGGPASVL